MPASGSIWNRPRSGAPSSSTPPDLGNATGPLHVDPVTFPVPDDPTRRTLLVDVFLHIADLFALAAVVQAMHDAGRIAEERPDDAGDCDDVHGPVPHLPGQ